MRVLVVHPGVDFSTADVFDGWTEALKGLGLQVATFTLHDRLCFYSSLLVDTGRKDEHGAAEVRPAMDEIGARTLAIAGLPEALYKFWPHLVLIVAGAFVSPEMMDIMRDRGHKVVVLHTESPYEDDRQLMVARHADANFINDPSNLERFRQVCAQTWYMPHAYRPSLHSPGPADPRLKCDFCFAGTGFQSRIDFFKAMDLDGIDTLLAGCWIPLADDDPLMTYLVHEKAECLDNYQVTDLYRSSRAGINIYRREAEEAHKGEGWAMGPRELEMAATGLFFLRDPRPEGDTLFPMLPRFDGPQDASEKLRWWLAHDRERERAAERARAAIAPRTFDRNAREMLRLLGY